MGLNAGMYSLSSGAELLAYFDRVMQQRFLPSGRVRFLSMSQVVGAYKVESLATNWLRMLGVSMKSWQRWSKYPQLLQWFAESRLNALFHPATHVQPDEIEKIALLQRYQQAVKPGIARLSELIATLQ